eukprot:2637428-Alexandrium_andersonii.AAC.1
MALTGGMSKSPVARPPTRGAGEDHRSGVAGWADLHGSTCRPSLPWPEHSNQDIRRPGQRLTAGGRHGPFSPPR